MTKTNQLLRSGAAENYQLGHGSRSWLLFLCVIGLASPVLGLGKAPEGKLLTVADQRGVASADAKQQKGEVPSDRELVQAVRSGSVASVRDLLAEGANVNARYEMRRTALIEAVIAGHVAVVEELIENPRVDVNAIDKHGATALWWAARLGHTKIVHTLLSRPGIDLNRAHPVMGRPLLIEAVARNQPEVVELILAHPEAHVNAKDRYSWTALMLAAYHGRTQLVELLVSRDDLQLNEVNFLGRTALMVAAEGGYVDIVKILLTRPGLLPNLRDKMGWTVERIAAEYHQPGVVEALRELGPAIVAK